MNNPGDSVIDLKEVSALDADAAGTIYALVKQDDGSVSIALLDGRQEVLEAQQRQASLQEPVRISGPIVTVTVRTQPAVDFDVRGLQVAPSGRYLLLHGNSYQDSSTLAMAVVDLHGGQPLPAPAGASSRANGSRSAPGSASSYARQKQCRLHPVDTVLFGSRPGLVLYQAAWHAHSEEHLVLLTSDNRIRLYHVTHSLAAAEQTLHLLPSSAAAPQRYGLAGSQSAAAALSASPGPAANGATAAADAPISPDIVAFAFGPAMGWGLFSLLLLAADGLVYAVGPVAPFGLRCPAAVLDRLLGEEEAASEWLEAAFGEEAVRSPDTKNRWPVLPHVVEGVSPALLGPLNLRARQELPMPPRAATLAVSHTLTLARDADTGSSSLRGGSAAAAPASVSTAVVGFADGRLLSYAVAGPWVPVWCDSAPQYMSATGFAHSVPSAVRYKCMLRGGADGGAAAASPPALAAPRMALLDVVELPTRASRPSGTDRRRGPEGQPLGLNPDLDEQEGLDELEDDDAFGDGLAVFAPAVAAARRAMSVHLQAGMSSTAVASAAGGSAVTVWACLRHGGCWRISLPWSAMLPGLLSGGAGAAPAPGAGDPFPAELPPPAVTCVYDVTAAAQRSLTPAAAAAAVVGSCVMTSPLLGGGLLLLSAAGSLHYHQPAGAASMLMEQQRAGAASPLAVTPGQRGQQPPSASRSTPPAASPEQRKAQVEAHIMSVYGNLTEPPADRSLPIPPAGAPSPLTVASPEGLRHLTDCIAALRGKHMAFLHGASVDLRDRAEVLRGEAGKHAAAVGELAELAERLEGRQGVLEGRLARLKLLHDNLVERAGMLTSLHWSLPRALSRAEVALRDELSTLEARSASLGGQWTSVALRARRLVEERRSGGSEEPARGAAFRMGSVPEGQLGKVHEAIVRQYSGLAAARAALASLEQYVATAAADRTAAQLEKGLGLGFGLGA